MRSRPLLFVVAAIPDPMGRFFLQHCCRDRYHRISVPPVTGFAQESPTAQTRGKNVVAKRLREEFGARATVMVGDGASDLEVQGDVDFVVGFGGYAIREKVKQGADAFILSFSELPALLDRWDA